MGKSTAQIAAELGIAEPTVRVLLARAIHKIEAEKQIHRFAALVMVSAAIRREQSCLEH